jgi:hypothetical protein
MAPEGMVHTLEEIQRLLKRDGSLIDIHPVPEGYLIKALQNGRTIFSERKRETCSEDVVLAERAIKQAVEREIFNIDIQTEFDFWTYASSVSELSAYWEEQNAYEDRLKDEALIAQVEEIIKTAGANVEVAIHEKVLITRLRPVK